MRGRRWTPVAAVALAIGIGSPPAAHAASRLWSYDDLMHRLRTATITVGRAKVAVDPSLVVCNGVGRPTVMRGVRRWRRFTCTQTIFRAGTMRDVTFGLRTIDGRRFTVLYARVGP